jgi:hypothetical protein
VLTCGIEECGDTPNPVIHTHVSSRDVAATQVVDYAAHALASGLEPMSVDIPYPEDFIVDSALPYEFTFPPFNDTHIQLSESWMHQWLRDPGVLTRRPILRDSAWGAALCSFVRMLTPAFLVQAPLPPQLILDHVGALLSILAHDMRVQPDVVPRSPGLRPQTLHRH